MPATKEAIRLPARWTEDKAFDFLQIEAGQAYIGDQLGIRLKSPHTFTSDHSGAESCSYHVFDDGSLLYSNNSEDEVWCDYRDFVVDSLVPGIEAQGTVWSQEEADESDDLNARSLDEMDRDLLLYYCNGDETAARKLVGLEKAE